MLQQKVLTSQGAKRCSYLRNGRALQMLIRVFMKKNAIFKMFDSTCDGFSILVKTAESIKDYPLVFRFKNDSGEVWEFIVRDKQEQNKTIHDFLEECESKGKTHLLEKQIERAEQCLSLVRSELVNFDAYLIIQYLIVELLKNGGFDD